MAVDLGVRVGEVKSVRDDAGAGRVKVAIFPEDKGVPDEKLPFAFPVSPKHFYIRPKVGEAVLVVLSDLNNAASRRYYIGPVISQLNHLFSEQYELGSDKIFPTTPNTFGPAPSTNPELDGVFPDIEDVAVLGRKNCDIIIKDNDIRIRAGVKNVNNLEQTDISYNAASPAFIKLNYHINEPIKGNRSSVVVDADKIFLLSNSSNGNANNIAADRKELVSKEKLEELLKEGYKLPYGEKLVEFLLKFVDVFSNHTHNFPGLPPNKKFVEDINNAATDPLKNKRMLSDTVIIN
jgi:hypothetical protein